jgi:probable rRNA maturation factor
LGTITFFNNGIDPKIKGKQKLKNFLKELFQNEKVALDHLSYIFCKDAYLLSLNQNYLSHDTLTDILTFPLSDEHSPIRSEIYISIDRVRENAILLKVDFEQELLRVMIHGILHLCKYSDHRSVQKKIIREREDFYLEQYSFT